MDEIDEKEWDDAEKTMTQLIDQKEVRLIIPMITASTIHGLTWKDVEKKVSDLVDQKEVRVIMNMMTPRSIQQLAGGLSGKPLDK
jgi:hypothetical protein